MRIKPFQADVFTKKDIKYFYKARDLTQYSDMGRVQIGAIAVYKNEIIGMGYNTYKTHPLQCEYDKFRNLTLSDKVANLHAMHAEVMCIASIKKKDIDWSKVKLYIFREKKNKALGMCRPCKTCLQLIKDYGIKHIYYTTDESYVYEFLADAERKIKN